jgi:hypothetical protein
MLKQRLQHFYEDGTLDERQEPDGHRLEELLFWHAVLHR